MIPDRMADGTDPASEHSEPFAGGRWTLVWTAVIATLASAAVVLATVGRIVTTFTTNGLALDIAVDESAARVPTSGSATAHATRALVTIPSPDPGLVTLTVATIALSTVAALAIAGCAIAFTRELGRGRTFGAGSIRLLQAMAVIIWVGFVGCSQIDWAIGQMARAAARLANPGVSSTVPYWIGLAAVLLLGIVTIAFRRGARLQRDTEGLV